jgi:exopolysaccharide biosynthesis polyprenyl glycosylphosphotransferase
MLGPAGTPAAAALPGRSAGRPAVGDDARVAHDAPRPAERPTRRGESGLLQNVLLDRNNRVLVARILADALAVFLAFTLSYYAYQWMLHVGVLAQQPLTPKSHGGYATVAVLFWSVLLVVFWQLDLYRPRPSVLNLWELETALKGGAFAAATFFSLLFFLKFTGYSRIVVVGAISLTAALVLLERRLFSSVLGRMHLSGRLGRRVLIYGCGPTGRLLMKKIVQTPQTGCSVAGFLDDAAAVGSRVACRITQTGPVLYEAPILGRGNDLEKVVAEHGIDELFVAAGAATAEKQREVFRFCQERRIRVGLVPQLEELRADQLRADDLSAIPVLRPYSTTSRVTYMAIKRSLDMFAAVLLIGVTAPLWLMAAIMIPIDSRGPLFFVQERVGLNGRLFRVFKFRTMYTESDPYALSPAGDVDPRITRVGRVLRTTGLDELPQLLNVLGGSMSLVGPRPEMPFIVDQYTPLERKRLLAKPGITGLWQLSADRHAQIHENIEYDLYYVSHRSLQLDLLILLETVLFTIGLAFRLAGRHAAQELQPAVVPTTAMEGVDEPYLLVALDQRRNGVYPSSWQSLVPSIYEVADRWPVKVLVAPDNIGIFDGLLQESIQRLGTARYRLAYVSYHSRTELRTLVLGARCVVTDLPHVTVWAKDFGKDLMAVQEDGIRTTVRTPAGKEVLQAIGHLSRQREDAMVLPLWPTSGGGDPRYAAGP